jgi:hypothetical protein
MKMSIYYPKLLKVPREIVLGPTVYIAIKRSQPHIWPNGDKMEEERIISLDIATFTELEIHIDLLINELMTIKREGQIYFKGKMIK